MDNLPRWKDYLLKTKMFLAFSAASLFIVALTCLIFYHRNVSDFRAQTVALSDTITRQFSRTFELYVQDIEKLSVSIIGDPVIQQSLIDHYKSTYDVEQNQIELQVNNRLFSHLQPRPQLQSIYIFSLDDFAYYVSKASGPKTSFNLQDESWYADREAVVRNKFLLLPVAEEETGGGRKAQVISFVRNINRIPFREVTAYMKININVNIFKNMLVNSDSNEVERNMRVFIVTDGGSIVYDGRSELTGRMDAGLASSAFRQPGRSGDLVWQGRHYLYTLEKSAYTKWNTVILIPNEFLLSKQKKAQYILLIVGMLAMLLIAAVSYLLSHQITLPLRSMMTKMSRVELGDLSQRMTVEGRDEIGRLSRIYNNMLDSITRLISEVYESKLAEKSAQLSALQAQINPHFLYNTLNIMKSISRIRGIEEVAEMSESLAELFQYSMKNLQHPVPLRNELDHIRNYMNIQQHRFSNRFELIMAVPDELLDASVLKLTIQPLVENAVIHGLGKVKAGGCIAIRASRRGPSLIVEVSDNGAGMDGNRLHELRYALRHSGRPGDHGEETHGIGLRNIGQRIQLLYGEDCGIELAGNPGGGLTVRLVFPYRRHDHAEGGTDDEYLPRRG